MIVQRRSVVLARFRDASERRGQDREDWVEVFRTVIAAHLDLWGEKLAGRWEIRKIEAPTSDVEILDHLHPTRHSDEPGAMALFFRVHLTVDGSREDLISLSDSFLDGVAEAIQAETQDVFDELGVDVVRFVPDWTR